MEKELDKAIDKTVKKDNAIKQRIAKWDNAKFFLIYLVVLGHMINKIAPNAYMDKYRFMQRCVFIIYTFHMPAFLFINGLFAKKTVDNKRYDKIGSFLRLYIIMSILKFAAVFAVDGKASYKLLYEEGVAWYALSLFSMFLIAIFLKPYRRVEMIIGTIVLGMVIGYDTGLDNFLSLTRTFTYLPFFLIGYYFDIKKFLNFIEKTSVKIVSWTVLVAYCAGVCLKIKPIYFMYHAFLKGKSSYEVTFTAKTIGANACNYGWLYRLIYYFVAFAVMVAFLSIIPNVQIPFVTTLGSRTLPVFVIHFSVIIILMDKFKMLKTFRGMENQKMALLLCLGISLCIQLILSIKPFNDLLNKIMSAPNSDL